MPTSPIIRKHEGNPIITAAGLPFEGTIAYNCGACRFHGRYLMLFRVDVHRYDNAADARMHIWPPKSFDLKIARAWSDDGVHFKIDPEPALTAEGDEPNVYDPRIQVVDGKLYLAYASDTPYGIRSGLAVSDDAVHFKRLYLSEPDNRNAVLFPERIGGLLTRLDRPFARSYASQRPYDIWLSQSPDGVFWGRHKLVLPAQKNPWSNDKIGPATPPIRTKQGWLALYHGVTLDPNRPGCGWSGTWSKLYRAGVMLLDLDEPHRIIGISKEPVLVPDQPYELPAGGGMRPDVVFPGGLVEEPDGTCKIYWGAADTTVAVGTASVSDLVALCTHKVW
ncbi:MAG: glycoside hydrolase family 130 protein [Phycisphaerae bacterium]